MQFTNCSSTVLINGLPACRQGDMIQETVSVNTIALGCPTVFIGG
ncbi:MAG: PAAR domain-containing protein [Limnoraphis sp. WC205]|nr:PAAR domain-containing protein [Limnoraphis sp. WC205]